MVFRCLVDLFLDDLFLVMLLLSALASLLRAHSHSSSPGQGRGTPLRNVGANQSFYINEDKNNDFNMTKLTKFN